MWEVSGSGSWQVAASPGCRFAHLDQGALRKQEILPGGLAPMRAKDVRPEAGELCLRCQSICENSNLSLHTLAG